MNASEKIPTEPSADLSAKQMRISSEAPNLATYSSIGSVVFSCLTVIPSTFG